MAANEIHKGDIGTRFKCTIKDGDTVVDISTVTTKQIKFTKPSGELLTKTASFFTDGTDGIIYYDTIEGDLDEVGSWELEGYVVFSSSSKFNSDIKSFKVHRVLE